tara:strand:+ start:834 stop:1223 length:390 start_codon:yes stop_codon:yes gene_type:complete
MKIPNEIAKKSVTSKYIITLNEIPIQHDNEVYKDFCDNAEIQLCINNQKEKLMKKILKDYNNIVMGWCTGAEYATGRPGFFIGDQEVYLINYGPGKNKPFFVTDEEEINEIDKKLAADHKRKKDEENKK